MDENGLCFPTKKDRVGKWILDEVYRRGLERETHRVCKDDDCKYMMIIEKEKSYEEIKKEVCFQKICAENDLALPVEDWWLCKKGNKGGVIISPLIEKVLTDETLAAKSSKDKWEWIKLGLFLILKLHMIGIIHGDTNPDNMVLQKENDQVFFTHFDKSKMIDKYIDVNEDYKQFLFPYKNSMDIIGKKPPNIYHFVEYFITDEISEHSNKNYEERALKIVLSWSYEKVKKINDEWFREFGAEAY